MDHLSLILLLIQNYYKFFLSIKKSGEYMDLIVFANPNKKDSHGSALLKEIENTLKAKKKDYKVIDLYAENFDPILRYDKKDPKIEEYQNLLKKADRYIFIYPIWWFTTPAILKGFIDKVFSAGFAFNFKTNGQVDQLLKGKKSIVLTTLGGPKEEIEMCKDAIANTFHVGVLGFCGVEVTKRIDWFNCRPGEITVPSEIKSEIQKSI